MYDYLVVGAGLYGAVFAREAKKAGKSVLVIDKRPHAAGNVYTEKSRGFMCISMVRIFFTQTIKPYGNILRSLLILTGSPTVRLPITRVSYIRCRLTCTRLTKCGVS